MVAKRFLLRAKKSNQVEILPSGMYSYHTDPTSPDQFRLHLRVEPDGNGILVVNAATVLHLNQTATEIAYNLIQGQDSVQIVDSISIRYDTSREVLMRDVQLLLIRYATSPRKQTFRRLLPLGLSLIYSIKTSPRHCGSTAASRIAVSIAIMIPYHL